MKQFVKMVLAVICGIFICSVLTFVIGMTFIGAVAAAGSSSTVLPKQGVLLMDMSKVTVAEQKKDLDLMGALQGNEMHVVGLWDAVQAINAAAYDNSVQYIYLKPEATQLGMAHLYELRKALSNFRHNGKAIVSYMDNVTTAGYYLASVSDKVYMTSHQGGTSMFYGISGQLYFLKDILDRLGVNVQLIRHGKYKSAGEMYIKNEASPENMEQNRAMISSIWKTFAEEMAASRDMTPERLNVFIDGLLLNSPEDFLNAGLVDGLLTSEELKDKLATLAVVDSYKDVKFINFADYVANVSAVAPKARQKIAVIYADGNIVDGTAAEDVAGDRFASIIAKVREDSSVKAVVFRVNSPGGSVLASEKIKAEIDMMKEVKPVVASYGNYAASGGYWVSAASSKIFADPTTLTGSIGVFSMIPDVSGTMKNIAHVNFTPVNSNRHSDMMSLMRPLDAAETSYMQDAVESIYGRFVGIVSEGRNLAPDFVDSIAQGRVWTGAEALEIGLVDEIGTLEDAIRFAANMVSEDSDAGSLNNWNVEAFPKPQTTMEMILERFNGTSEAARIFEDTPFASLASAATDWAKMFDLGRKESFMLARMPFEVVWGR